MGPEKRNEVLSNAVALLHPINFSEPFGLSVVESMACGTPVIAFNRGSMPELIMDGKNGFLVSDYAGAIEAVGGIKRIDRKSCRQTVEDRFTDEIMVNNYIKVYQKILRETKSYAGRQTL